VRATKLLFRGQRQRRAGQHTDAVDTLARAAERAPDSPHVTLHHALALADAGQPEPALAALAHAAERWPHNPVFPLFRGALLVEGGQLAEGSAALAAARKLSPHNRLAAAYDALVAMRQGHVDQALRRLGASGFSDNARALAAILAEVEAELFRHLGPNTDGQPVRRTDLPPPSRRLRRKSAARLAALGAMWLERGDPLTAWQLLTLAAEKNPSEPEVFAHLGAACYDLGEFDQAIAHLNRVGSWSKMLDMAMLHRGAALYKLGRFDEALDALEAARKADEMGNFTTWIQFLLGRTLVALGRADEARPHFRRFIDLEGDMAIGRLRQARELLGLAVPDGAPQGFELVDDAGTVLVVRPECREAIKNRQPAPDDGEPPKSGRAPLERIAVPGGVALVRPCRRGGLLGNIVRTVYLDGARFVRELAVADALHRRGIPTPEIIAAVRREVVRGAYRGEIIVREVPGAVDLAEALRTLPDGDAGTERKRQVLCATARLIRQAHDAGLRHPDLNARNILLAPDGTALVIDLDRAELADELSLADRTAMLARLYRSLHKLGLAPQPVTDDDWTAFYTAYAGDNTELTDAADGTLARCHRELARHRRWWRLTGGGGGGKAEDGGQRAEDA